jgi:regulatory protein
MEPRRPRKISPRYIENAAIYYLKRYSSTTAQLRRVLSRKVNRSLRVHPGDKTEALVWIDAVVEKLVRLGYLNDTAYARGKAQSLRASGKSTRTIRATLRNKGISNAVSAAFIEPAQDEDAAWIWARKKRLGPYCKEPSLRRELRQKHLASLARAGFGFDIARRVIDGEAP